MNLEHIQQNTAEKVKQGNFEKIQLMEIEYGIYLLLIDRPKSLNALNRATLEEIDQAITIIELDQSARVLLIQGSGDKAFVAGADIKEMCSLSPREAKDFSQRGVQVMSRLEQLPIPVIALVNGYALGGGCELAMSCDFILSADHSIFSQPEVGLGITTGFGGSQRLTRLVGRAMAMEMLVSGRRVKAEEALHIGLVNHLYPLEQLQEEGLKLARLIRNKSANAVRLTKELVQRGQNIDLDNACGMESMAFSLCFKSDDQQEGMHAFMDNRQPAFSGG